MKMWTERNQVIAQEIRYSDTVLFSASCFENRFAVSGGQLWDSLTTGGAISRSFHPDCLFESIGVNNQLLRPLVEDSCHCTMHGFAINEPVPPVGLRSKHFRCVHSLDSHPQQT